MVVPPGALSRSTIVVLSSYHLDSRVTSLVSGFAALVAAVEAVVPHVSGSTAPTTAASTALGPNPHSPLACPVYTAVPRGGAVVPLILVVVPLPPAVVPLLAGLDGG